jgi:hypothetical protein
VKGAVVPAARAVEGGGGAGCQCACVLGTWSARNMRVCCNCKTTTLAEGVRIGRHRSRDGHTHVEGG